MKKDVLFLCQFFYPEYNSSATLPFDTAKFLAEKGLTVDALVGYPKEYHKDGEIPLVECVDGVKIQRVKYIELSREKKINRLINYFSFTLAILRRVYKLKKYRCVIVYSNPPVLPIIPIIAKKLFDTEFIFCAYDIYPEVAYASKALVPGDIISRVMSCINHHLYKNAAGVVALTDEMKDFLLQNRKELSRERVTTIANWAHEKRIEPDFDAYNRFEYKVGQFIVSYFGNMGTCQDMETLMGAAELLKDENRIKFFVVGHGNKMNMVKERANKLSNMKVMDFLTGKEFEQAVAISSCCVVSLEKGLMGTCAPSKFYSYLQGGQPVIAVVEKESYLTKEVIENKIGYAVEQGDCQGLVNALMEMMLKPQMCVEMSERARNLYNSKYDIDIALQKYEILIKKIVKRQL